jgi:hypothetical protein
MNAGVSVGERGICHSEVRTRLNHQEKHLWNMLYGNRILVK